ncbi:hypothetical protein [Lentzea sp.]|uniref:hypothetical protein n=1 Tax=Lentzea sp. TaxID=56099 RepID=UPI002C1E3E91|nr:hypothetical protein [Lentzea sp.]HUQ54424.1 hypothetical protein [Lentzea sp.]
MTVVVVFVVVVVVVLEEEDGTEDEDDDEDEDDTVCDGVSVCVGSSDGVLMSETRALLSPSGVVGSPDASEPTSGAST